MKRTDLPKLLHALLQQVPYVTLATVCPNGKPWNSPVFGCFDEDLTLYWASWPRSQHSRNIGHNPTIFVVPYDSRAAEGEAIGLYFEMKAKVLTRKREVAEARKMYTATFGETLAREPFIYNCARRLYKAIPQRIWRNTDSSIQGDFIDVRRRIA